MTDSATFAREDDIDFSSFDRIDAVRSILQVLVRSTGMRTALVARVTPESWTLCAIEDGAGFALQPGDQLELQTTF
jgi:hypothetical protein